MTIQEYFGDWSAVIDLNEANRIMQRLSMQQHCCCPNLKDIFKAFRLCPFHSLRVVIIAQDPYSNLRSVCCNSIAVKTPVATGLAFANAADTPKSSYSPSLEVLMESVIDYTVPHRTITFEPDLEKWEEQGVLLLNSALTCETGKAGSHALLWRPFMTSFLTNLSKCSSGIVYVLMGRQAQSFLPYINQYTNHVLLCQHPAWYARQRLRMPSDIWQQVNTILTSLNGSGIEWYKEN